MHITVNHSKCADLRFLNGLDNWLLGLDTLFMLSVGLNPLYLSFKIKHLFTCKCKLYNRCYSSDLFMRISAGDHDEIGHC